MSTSNTPSKRSSNDNEKPPKPKLNLAIAPSSLKKPKAKPAVVPATQHLWQAIHIELEDGDQLCCFFLMCDGQLEVNMCTPLYFRKELDCAEYLKVIDCIGHIFNPITPAGTKVNNSCGYPMKALFFSIGLGMTKQEIRAHVELCVHPRIILTK
jgi:hypothetical protein